MGKISQIYSSYKKGLDRSQADYEESVKSRADNAKKLYDDLLNRLIINLGPKKDMPGFASEVTDRIRAFFGKENLNFVAVDGSCDKYESGEFISFYGGAYGARGALNLSHTPPKIEYKRWELEKDVSMVAFVPVPYSQLNEVTDIDYEEKFLLSEAEKVDLANMHLLMMQLAEVFLAYNTATASVLDQPNILLIDNSISTMLGSVDLKPSRVKLVGYEFDRRTLNEHDIVIAQAHPFNFELGVPSIKNFSSDYAIISYFHRHRGTKEVLLADIEVELGLPAGSYPKVGIDRLVDERKLMVFDRLSQKIATKTDPWESWEYTKHFFQNICKRIFLDKDELALKFPTKDEDGKKIMRWLSPIDVQFLIGVGLRALIETCWEKKILLAGIAKDSQSQYLTRNYLGVCRLRGVYPELTANKYGALPPTDRAFCELLPYLDDSLSDPWGTIEFDSSFMTLYGKDASGKEVIVGTFGGIVRPERLFLRSIVQFYTRRKGDNVVTGHAVFVDRLAYPDFDLKNIPTLEINENQVGRVLPLLYKDKNTLNIGQIITYFILDKLTKNHFPEVIGYPDPLHKADLGAKTMRDHVKELLKSSEWKFRTRPLTRTFREIRQSFRRTP